MSNAPLVVVIAGPNGAGKSTSAPLLLQDALSVHEFVNADVIASGLSAFQPEKVALAAGRIMLRRMKDLAAARADFAFETTLASRTFAPWLAGLRSTGYRTHLVFLALPTTELAIERAAARVRQGGHSIPEDVIRRRFKAGLRNFFLMYQEQADRWQIFDNTRLGDPYLIASGHGLDSTNTIRHDVWESLRKGVPVRKKDQLHRVDRPDDVPRILKALRKATREALRRHKQAGNPVPTWQHGRTVWVQPKDIPDFKLSFRDAEFPSL